MEKLYQKIGNGRGTRYVEAAEYIALDSYPIGSHLTVVRPGEQTRIFNIKPENAALIAASLTASEAMISAMMLASKLSPSRAPLTKKQRKAWDEFSAAMGSEMMLTRKSFVGIVECGIAALNVAALKAGGV